MKHKVKLYLTKIAVTFEAHCGAMLTGLNNITTFKSNILMSSQYLKAHSDPCGRIPFLNCATVFKPIHDGFIVIDRPHTIRLFLKVVHLLVDYSVLLLQIAQELLNLCRILPDCTVFYPISSATCCESSESYNLIQI